MLSLRNYMGRIALLLSIWLSGCTDPFEPEVISSPESYLVVDGFINTNGITTIKLSRTQSLATTATPPAESRATVAIEDDAGTAYPLAEQAPGTYASQALTLSPSRRYRLRLRTTAGRDYESDLVAAKLTPPIDRVAWAVGPTGVRIAVNTRDPTNNTRYYRWKYEETWEFRSAHQSDIEYVASTGTVELRTENIYRCWRSVNSNLIQLSSTEQLTEDVVSDFFLVSWPANSEQFRYGYSLLVRQYALTADEYAYWDKLKKNTESLGGLFDPLPTQLTGNVHCRQDADETVVGYVGATSVAEQRIFIATADLPPTQFETGYEDCGLLETVLVKDFPTPLLLVEPVGPAPPYAYLAALPSCVDCRLRGTNVKPSFWP